MKSSSSSNTQKIKTNSYLYFVGTSLVLLLIILAGHFQFFIGANFFGDVDNPQVYLIQMLNEKSNGWRPDQGIGLSHFFGDPGVTHVWGLYRWWHHLFEDEILAHSLTILALMWGVSFSMFVFLRRAVPNLGTVPSIALALLIPFGSLRYEFIFQRHYAMMLISGPIISILLYDFLKEPKTTHYFQHAVLLFLTLFLGSFYSLLMVLLLSILFFLAYFLYNRIYENPRQSLQVSLNYISLNLVAAVSIVVLGAWIFFSLFYEQFSVGYLRDPHYSINEFLVSPSVVFLINRIYEYLQAGLLPADATLLGIEQALSRIGWTMVSPIFPVFLIILFFKKPNNFWEFAAKFFVVGLILYQEIIAWVPGFLGILHSIFNLYPPSKIQPFIQVYQVLFIGLFIARILSNQKQDPLPGNKGSQIISLILSILYATLFFVALGAIISPDKFESVSLGIFNQFTSEIDSETIRILAPALISENIRLFNEIFGFSTLIFYVFSLIFLLFIFFKSLPRIAIYSGGILLTLALLANNIFLSWANFPMNEKPLIWERQKFSTGSIEETFEPTDRLTRIGVPPCRGSSNYAICIKKKFFDGEFGPLRRQLGYGNPPLLEFSRNKSFSSKNVTAFVAKFMSLKGKDPKGILRELSYDPPITSSRLFDISAVNYFFSAFQQPVTENLELVHKSKGFYLYKNKNAWPYFYFADRIETILDYEDLYNAKQGTAYLWADENIEFTSKSPDNQSTLKLTKFEYGNVEIQYESGEKEFLVMADTWHPNWRAKVDGNEIDVMEANGVFKGVLLPAGKHKLHFFFDNSSYLPGVWISIVAWVVFLSAWCWASRSVPPSEKETKKGLLVA